MIILIMYFDYIEDRKNSIVFLDMLIILLLKHYLWIKSDKSKKKIYEYNAINNTIIL